MGGDLTSTADSLLASNPQEAAKQGIAPKGMVTIGDLWEKSSGFEKNNPKNLKLSKPDATAKRCSTGTIVLAQCLEKRFGRGFELSSRMGKTDFWKNRKKSV